jgi:hypothetical protein
VAVDRALEGDHQRYAILCGHHDFGRKLLAFVTLPPRFYPD